MPSNWKTISSDPDYAALSPADKAAVKQHYFDRAIASDPDFLKMGQSDRASVRASFFGENAPAAPIPKKHYRAIDVPGAALGHLIQSGEDFAGKVGHTLADPAGTLKKLDAIGNAVPATASNAAGGVPDFQSLGFWQHAIGTAKGLGAATLKHFTDAYGGHSPAEMYDNIKRSLAEHPVETAADAVTAASGVGGVARTVATHAAGPIVGAAVGAAVRPVAHTAASAINPMNALDIPARAVQVLRNPRGVAANPRQLFSNAPTARVAGSLVRGAVNALRPADQILLDATEGQGHNALRDLRAAATPNPHNPAVTRGEIVEGSVPTAAQVTAAGGGPTRLAALGAAAAKRFPTASAAIQAAQNAARINAIRLVGGTPADLQAAIAAREAQSAHDYGISHAVTVHGDQDLLDLFNRPVMADVFHRAQEIAENDGRQFQIGHNIPAHTVHSTVLGPGGAPVPIHVPAQFASYSGRDLHTIKQAFDAEAFAKAQTYGINSAEVDAIRGARNQFIAWVEQPTKNPAYATARANHAAASRPIDQMRLLQYYAAKLQTPLSGEDTAALRADAFAGARDNALNEALGNTNLKRATGQQRVMHERNLLTPEQMAALDAVQADLARAKLTEEQVKAASQYKSVLGAPAAGGELSTSTNIPVRALNALAELFMHNTRDTVGHAMHTPETAAEALSNALARQDRLDRRSRTIHAVGRGVQAVNRYPALYNMLQHDPDNENALIR